MEWRKGPEALRAGDRVSLRQDGAVCELQIRGLAVEDSGEYSCVCGQERTAAVLTVRGKRRVGPRGPGAWCRLSVILSPLVSSRIVDVCVLPVTFSSLSQPPHPYSVSVAMFTSMLCPLWTLSSSLSVCSLSHSRCDPLLVCDSRGCFILDQVSPRQSDFLCVTLTLCRAAHQVHKKSKE